MQTETVLYECIQTLVKHIFLFNFLHELLTSWIKLRIKRGQNVQTFTATITVTSTEATGEK